MTRLQAIKPRIWLILFTLITVLYLSYTNYPKLREINWNPECHRSFHGFAYNLPPRADHEFEIMSPPSPWQVAASTSGLQAINQSVALYQTALARTVDGTSEIWVSLVDGGRSPSIYYIPQSYEGRAGFAIYRPQSGEWEIVPDTISDTGLYVINLIVDSSGTVWGQIRWDWFTDYPELETVPVLSRFNEDTRRFEFAEGVLEIPLVEDSSYFNYTQLVLDSQNIFWIVRDGGDIHRYDPMTLTTDLAGHIPGGVVTDAALSPDGSIYFLSYNINQMVLYLEDTTLFQFFPETGDTEFIEYPPAIHNWAAPFSLLIDHTGQLWLGAIGYRDLEDNRHLIHPHTCTPSTIT